MRVCLFGIFDPSYSRSRSVARGFAENGHEVVMCRVDPRVHAGWRKYPALLRAYRALPNRSFDLAIVGYPGQTVAWFAYLLFGRRLVLDAFLSLYNSQVEDRRLASRFSLRGAYYWLADFVSCMLARVVVLDTNAHIDYFARTFWVPRKKCVRLPVGTDERLFVPSTSPARKDFLIHFHGSYIPLHGIEHILGAAALLVNEKDIRIRIIGAGQTEPLIQERFDRNPLPNVEFLPPVPYEQLPTLIAEADVCLGIFGDTPKSALVIPNKLYEAVAAGRPVITADSPAVRELFRDGENVLLVPPANPRALADAILRLRDDALLRERLARNARVLYEQKLATKQLVAGAIADISRIIRL